MATFNKCRRSWVRRIFPESHFAKSADKCKVYLSPFATDNGAGLTTWTDWADRPGMQI